MAIHELLRRNRKLRAIKKRLAADDYTLDDLRDWWQFLSSYESSSEDETNHKLRKENHRFYIERRKSRKNKQVSPYALEWYIRHILIPVIFGLFLISFIIVIFFTTQ